MVIVYITSTEEMPSTHNYNNVENYDDDDELQQKVLRKRRFYPTRIGGVCVNAASGSRYPIQQGSFEELRLYRISDVTGFYDKNGYLRRRNDPLNHEPNMLYFDTPEQYMRHMRQKLPQESINRWHTNVKRMFPDNGDFDRAEYEKIRKENRSRMVRSSQVQDESQVVASSDDEWA